MGSSIGHRVEPREVTQWYAGFALLLGLIAAALSLLVDVPPAVIGWWVLLIEHRDDDAPRAAARVKPSGAT